jgi:hypothetical protein
LPLVETIVLCDERGARRHSGLGHMNGRQRRILGWVTVADLAAVVAGPVLADIIDTDVPVQCSVGIVAIVTFVGFLTFHMTGERERSPDAVMRPTIAATFVIVFLALVSVTAFFTGETEEVASPIASNLLSNFATLTGVVVAFYFGASAVEGALRQRDSTETVPEESSRTRRSELEEGSDAQLDVERGREPETGS